MHKFLKPLLILVIIVLILLSSRVSVIAQTSNYSDDFNSDNFDSYWDINNYASGNNGSFASNSELDVSKSPPSISIYGTGIHGLLFEEDRITGWFGKSVILKEQVDMSGPFTISVDYRLNSRNAENYSVLTIEFDKDNRIMYTVGNFVNNSTSNAALQFEEFNNQVRCINCTGVSVNISEGLYHQLSISFNPSTRIASASFDKQLISEEPYLGDIHNAFVGFGTAVRFPGNYIDTTFDNFTLTGSADSSAILNVTDLKQYTSPWGSMEYNSATSWFPSDPTITRWGCALTSASMVLQYHGHNIFPDSLNTWLLNQPDGYIGNGYLNWLAISRYSLQNQSSNSSPLEFRLFNNDNDPQLKQEIDDNQPAIVRIPGHFVVVKGNNNDNFFINDPASSTFTTLSETETFHGGNYQRMYSYVPSNTDLSYMMFITYDDITIEASDSANNPVGTFFIEEPIVDAVENTYPNDEPLGIFLLEKPNDDIYHLTITGNPKENYKLNTYIYDKNGEVEMFDHKGKLKESTQEITFLNPYNKPLIIHDSFAEAYQLLLNNKKSIYNNWIYKYLIRSLKRANIYHLKGRYRIAKWRVNYIIRVVKRFTPRFIDKSFSNELVEALENIY